MRNIAIFLNGGYSDNLKDNLEDIIKNYEIIAVDGGANKIYEFGLVPNKIVGDMDSISENVLEEYKNVPQIRLNSDKDYTDFEVALLDKCPSLNNRFINNKSKSLDFSHLNDTNIIVFGATGKRLDMTLANLNLLKLVPNMKYIDENLDIVFYTNKDISLNNKKNKKISILPISNITELSLIGFRYELDKVNISNNTDLVSNTIESNFCEIKFKDGEMYIILEQ